jgi:hypothetical protein
MKKIVFGSILLALTSLNLQAEPRMTTGDIDQKFADLIKKRVGLESSAISALKDPFYDEATKIITPAEQTGLTLTAVIGSKAKINGSWYHLGDPVGSLYTITEVKPRSVVLSIDDGQQIELNLNQGNKNVIITNN